MCINKFFKLLILNIQVFYYMNSLIIFIIILIVLLVLFFLYKIVENFDSTNIGIYNRFYQQIVNPYLPIQMTSFFSNDIQEEIKKFN